MTANEWAEALAEISEGVDLDAPVPDDPAIVAMRALRAEVAAVAWNDPAAQKTMTAELVRRYAGAAGDEDVHGH